MPRRSLFSPPMAQRSSWRGLVLATTVIVAAPVALIGGAGRQTRTVASAAQVSAVSSIQAQTTAGLPTPVRPSTAFEVSPQTTLEHMRRARSVVVATCVDRRVDRGPGGNVFTYYRFRSEQVVRGEEQSSFELRLLGGTLGDVTVSEPLDRRFEPGKQYVLMLGARNNDGHPTLNPAAVFAVGKEPQSGREVVVPGPTGLPLFSAATGDTVEPNANFAFLADFVASIRRAR